MNDTITAHYLGKPVTISLADVTHFTSSDGYTTAHYSVGELLLNSHDSLTKLAKRLDPEFVRISKNCVVRRSLVTGVRRLSRYHEDDRGGLATIGELGIELKIGFAYVKTCGFF